MFYEKNETKQNDQKRGEKFSSGSRTPNLRRVRSRRYSIAQRKLLLNKIVQFSIFNIFAHKIMSVDAVWRWQGFIYEQLKNIFEEKKYGFDGKNCSLTHPY